MRQHDGYDEYAVLYRTNAQSRILEESLTYTSFRIVYDTLECFVIVGVDR